MKTKEVVFDVEKSLAPWLGKTVKIMDYYFQEALNAQGLDISKEQMIVLHKLDVEDGLTQNELAMMTYRDKSSLARLIAKMEKKNYVIRRQREGDKRSNLIYLTDLGRDIFQRAIHIVSEMAARMEEDITEAEITEMIGILKKIQHNISKETTKL